MVSALFISCQGAGGLYSHALYFRNHEEVQRATCDTKLKTQEVKYRRSTSRNVDTQVPRKKIKKNFNNRKN